MKQTANISCLFHCRCCAVSAGGAQKIHNAVIQTPASCWITFSHLILSRAENKNTNNQMIRRLMTGRIASLREWHVKFVWATSEQKEEPSAAHQTVSIRKKQSWKKVFYYKSFVSLPLRRIQVWVNTMPNTSAKKLSARPFPKDFTVLLKKKK